MVAADLQSPSPPQRRLVLLGASNLSRGLPTLLEIVRHGRREPLDILAAPGRGRSYGLTSRILGRSLISLTACGLWPALDSSPAIPTDALITDVGNDILYGVPPATLLAWVETVVERLRTRDGTIIVTGLPMTALKTLGPRRFTLLRTVLFPGKKLGFSTARQRAEEVDAGLRRLAAKYGATFVEPRDEWYGWDPIHIRRSQWSAAWQEIVAAWRMERVLDRVHVPFVPWLVEQFRRPAERRLFGIVQRCRQPCRTWSNGTRLSIF